MEEAEEKEEEQQEVRHPDRSSHNFTIKKTNKHLELLNMDEGASLPRLA